MTCRAGVRTAVFEEARVRRDASRFVPRGLTPA